MASLRLIANSLFGLETWVLSLLSLQRMTAIIPMIDGATPRKSKTGGQQ